MKEKTGLKRLTACFMAVILFLTSAPLASLAGIDNFKFNLRVNAADSVDYSELSPNQYMAKMLLNYDYNGCTAGDVTIPQEQLSYYLSPDRVSPARRLRDELERSNSFMSGVAAWKVLTFDPSEAYENLLDEKDYYMAILYSIIDVQFKDNEFLKALNCSTNKTILSLSKSTASIMKKFYEMDCDANGLKGVTISDFTDAQFQEFYGKLLDLKESKDFYSKLGKNLSYANNAIKGCKTVYDVVNTVSKYSQLTAVSDALLSVIYSVYQNSTDSAMRQAANEVYKVCSEQLSKIEYTLIESGEEVANLVFSKVLGLAWDVVIDAACGLGTAFKFGQAIGKSISNFCFSTDKTIEQYYALAALVKFEDVAIRSVESLADSFKANQSESNADNYMEAVKVLFSVYSLGCDYADSFVDTAVNKGLVNTIENAFGINQNFTEYRKTLSFIKSLINDMKTTLTNLESYSGWYEEDAPTAYKEYFETENTTPPYSDNTQPLYCEPVSNTQSGEAVLKYKVESDNTITVIGCDPSSFGIVNIPKDYGGKAIRKIASNAFSNCTGITEITIPNSVTEIGRGAFSGCTNLTNVTLNNGLKTINGIAFSGTSLTSVKVPKTVTYMGTASDYSCFSGIETLKTVEFEYGMLKIPANALDGCKTITNVVIPNGVTEIGDRAFSGCTGITEIAIPDSVTEINGSAFKNCTNLKKVYAVKNTAGHKFALDNNLEFVEMSCSHSQTELVVDSVQSCEKDGVNRNVCKLCGTTVSTETKKATGHNYSTEVILVKPTCRADGLKKVICSKCGNVAEQTVPALSHTVIVYGESKAATCTSSGSVAGEKCSVCGEILVKQTEIPALGHTEVKDKAVAATCTKKGKTAGSHCSVCGAVIKAQKAVSALGHKYKTTTKKATTSKNGKTVTACTVCGKVKKTSVIYKASSVKLSKTSYTYNGKTQKPKVVVKTSKGKVLTEGKDYTVKYQSGRKNPGTYTVTVTFKGNYSGKKTLTFTIAPKAPTLKATAAKKSAKLSWNKQTGATGYNVYMATSKNGKYKKIATVKNGKVSYTKTGLTKGKTYYFKVAAYTTSGKKTINSAYSAVKSVKVK